MNIIKDNLSEQDLHVDCVYGGSRNGNYSDDPLPKLLNVDNGAGFRCLGSPRTEVESLKILVLQTGFSDQNWPDHLDKENGLFIYYGDKREPSDLHDTKRDCNNILRNLFDFAHQKSQTIDNFPIILLFGKTGSYRDTRFLGIAVPSAKGMSSDEDLTAVWRMNTEGIRFQNYRSVFTILDAPVIKRQWIHDALIGNSVKSIHAPSIWLKWVQNRKYTPLLTESSIKIRSPKQQTDLTKEERTVIELIYNTYKLNPTGFEPIAADILTYAMPNVHSIEITKPWRDGGRDATGKYKICQGPGGIDVDFAMEVKCYAINNGVGVKEVARLISRLRHRLFGVLVTTSYVSTQAYKELKKDEHPIVILSAADIALLLIKNFGNLDQITHWLNNKY